jgi:hypothetical protein
MSDQRASLTYSSYLALDEVLGAQRPRTDEHDELLFIVIHQVYELDGAGVAHTVLKESGWTVITVHESGSCRKWSWIDEANLLRQLTVWVGGEHRTRGHDRGLRRRLLWALVAAGQNYDARWVPGYRPVECRVSGTDRADAFNTVVCSRRRRTDAIMLKLGGGSARLVDLAYALAL